MNKTPLRSEIAIENKWKVEDLFPSDEEWEKEYQSLSLQIDKKCEYEGKLGKSADTLLLTINEMNEAEYLSERIYVYAFMRYYEDTSNAIYQEMSGKAQNLSIKLAGKYAFFEPELMSLDGEWLKEAVDSNSGLKEYSHFINDCVARKAHTLSQKEEALLAGASAIATVPSEIFSKFNNADVKFGMIKDEKGNDAELSNGKFAMYMQSHDRRVRKEAFYGLYRQYKAYLNTIAAAFYGNVKQAVFYANARGYKSTLEMYLSQSFIPENVYTNLIQTVNDNLDLMHRYVTLRKNMLNVEELHFYDIYAPMVPDYDWKINFEEAKEIAIKALAPLGEEYISKLKEGFDSGWIDVYENVGKRSGAFSWGAYGTHPYVFLNYSDTLDDLFTLVHEMGHAMHTFYSNNTQPYVYAGYRIFVAEVASTCNEALLMNYLLDTCRDEKQRKYLLNHYFEQFKGTLFRQTMFAEFELEAHSMAMRQEVLSAENLSNLYRGLNEKYFGEDMVIDSEISCEWARIPHFYTPFYVYQYATGYSAAIAIAAKLIEGDKNALEGYKRFLSGGSSLHPIELLKLCGIDMTTPKVICDALDVFRNLLDQW